MPSIQHILCPVDVGYVSLDAIEQAAVLANLHRADLLLLYVFNAPLPLRLALPQSEGRLLDRHARVELLEELDRLAEPVRGRGIPVRTAVEEGDIALQIADATRSLPADLLVMATHSRSGARRLIFGSVAEETIRTAPCPVLTVMPGVTGSTAGKPSVRAFNEILCPVDFSPESLSALAYAISLAEESGGAVRVLHVVEWFDDSQLARRGLSHLSEHLQRLIADARARLKAVVPAASRCRIEVLDIVVGESAHAEVLRCAKTHSPDLIALGVRGRGALDTLLTGSTAKHVLREALCPVLTVPAAPVLTGG